MRIKAVFIRFYKSFNHDYLRKLNENARKAASSWDYVGEAYYPFVRVPINEKITTIVGANESGKSHLLSAIEKGLTGSGIADEDFCRYSQFFLVGKGEMRFPDFGFEWHELTPSEKDKLREVGNLPETHTFDSFHMFRINGVNPLLFVPGVEKAITINPQALSALLPRAFRIDSEVALPDSVSITALLAMAKGGEPNAEIDREHRIGIFESLATLAGSISSLKAAASGQATPQPNPIFAQLAALLERPVKDPDKESIHRKELRLAYDLIFKVAGVDTRALQSLNRAISSGKDGHANALAVKINQTLASRLNFPRVWAQDRQFALVITPRDHELVFTIRDRTGSEYSFGERSSGLKYFLSYYIQYLAHEPADGKTEILLMDEPDAFLSSQAQQDLLRIFDAFAEGENGRKPVQVIYVTHSPFLIDKNHAERIRVLEKGMGDEGTRVVKSASQNHYEPLRSSFGAFVGETAFIGNCNLFVEGPADQIIIGAAATYLRHRNVPESDNLDLNHITIVPAGGTPQIPYMVYLARGRSIERPATIVLLDSDKAGNLAKKDLLREPIRKKTLLKDYHIVQVGDLPEFGSLHVSRPGAPIEIEDLIPVPMAILTLKRYTREFWDLEPEKTEALFTEEKLQAELVETKSLFDAIETLVSSSLGEEYSVDKVAFARTLVTLLPQSHSVAGYAPHASFAGLSEFEENLKVLLRKLSQMQRKAEKELAAEQVGRKLGRVKSRFLQDHPVTVTKEKAALMLEELVDTLDASPESDGARIRIQALHRDFALDEDRLSQIDRYEDFQAGLEQVQYAGILDISSADRIIESQSEIKR